MQSSLNLLGVFNEMKWVYRVGVYIKKKHAVHGMQTNPLVLGAGAALLGLSHISSWSCSERHMMLSVPGRDRKLPQEQPALTLGNRTCFSRFSGPTSFPCCHITPNPTVCDTKEPLGLSWPRPACCSLTPCPAFLAAQNDLIPIWPRGSAAQGQPEGPGDIRQ